jgi:uncharacterized protein YcbK (DUF882 family)
MKKALEALFIGDDGRVSWTAVASFVGIILTIQWNVHYYYLGWEYKPDELTFLEFIIGAFLFGRVVQRGVYYGTNALEEVKRGRVKPDADHVSEVGKKAAPAQPKQTTPALSSNFSVDEFESKDGTRMNAGVKKNILELIKHMEVIRAACGNQPIKITSGYRSSKHNAAVGGSKTSEHVKGRAADFTVKGKTPKQVYDIIEELINRGAIPAGGLGLYKRWVHYDFRGVNVRWKG